MEYECKWTIEKKKCLIYIYIQNVYAFVGNLNRVQNNVTSDLHSFDDINIKYLE